jgi:glucose-specific phosphotransferase system IIA component
VSLEVVSPVAGEVVGLAAVPDQVFSDELVGAGTAVEPPAAEGRIEVVAPVAGALVKVHPHAFVVLGAEGVGVLVHLGIDTVGLKGEGFELLRAEGDTVERGSPVVAFDPAAVRRRGLSAVCPVVVLDTAPGAVTGTVGAQVRPGDPLFTYGS